MKAPREAEDQGDGEDRLCPWCGRPLDDHQLRDLRRDHQPWREVPLCVEAGTIRDGIRLTR